jgi:hypothetical protein
MTTAKAGIRPDDLAIAQPAEAGLPANGVIRVSRLTMSSDHQMDRRLETIAPKLRNAAGGLLKKYAG